jgi:hypothetical protein
MTAAREPGNETAAAVEALVYRLRNRGDGEGQFATDDEFFAAEFIAAIRGRGWRPVLALVPAADWRTASGNARVPDARKPGSAEYLAQKAAIKARATGPQVRLTEENDPKT